MLKVKKGYFISFGDYKLSKCPMHFFMKPDLSSLFCLVEVVENPKTP